LNEVSQDSILEQGKKTTLGEIGRIPVNTLSTKFPTRTEKYESYSNLTRVFLSSVLPGVGILTGEKGLGCGSTDFCNVSGE